MTKSSQPPPIAHDSIQDYEEDYSRVYQTETRSRDDLLRPEGMDELFTAPLFSRNQSDTASTQSESRFQFQPLGKQLLLALRYLVPLLLTSAMTMFLPGAFPFQSTGSDELFFLNCSFLVSPLIGVLLARYVRVYLVGPLLFLQVSDLLRG